jgi:hypothetical protein
MKIHLRARTHAHAHTHTQTSFSLSISLSLSLFLYISFSLFLSLLLCMAIYIASSIIRCEKTHATNPTTLKKAPLVSPRFLFFPGLSAIKGLLIALVNVTILHSIPRNLAVEFTEVSAPPPCLQILALGSVRGTVRSFIVDSTPHRRAHPESLDQEQNQHPESLDQEQNQHVEEITTGGEPIKCKMRGSIISNTQATSQIM